MKRHLSNGEFIATRWNFDWRWILRAEFEGMTGLTVCEVGIGPSDISILPWFAGRASLIGVDPHPKYAREAEKLPNSLIHQCAVGPNDGTATLILNGGSSFLLGNWSPTPAPKAHELTVEVRRFDSIDPGNIDILNLDCEGGERWALEQMISKPKVIGVELWKANPDREWILEWLRLHDYVVRATTGPEGETMIWSL